MPTGKVNLATGQVGFTLPLVSLPERNGLGAQVALRYSSAVSAVVDTWNLEAPTGPAGLGWTLPTERVIRDPRSTGSPDNDAYFLVTGEGFFPLVRRGDSAEGEIYSTRNFTLWKIRFQRPYQLWTVIREDGTRFFYGGNGQTPFGEANALEWSVRWGNWLGVSVANGGQQRYVSVWDLCCVENPRGDRVRYQYQQSLRYVGAAGAGRQQYTASCRLTEIIGAGGEKAVLRYQEKDAGEYQRWNTAAGTAQTVRRIRGRFTASGPGSWDTLNSPDPAIRIEVTGAQARTYAADNTTGVDIAFDLPETVADPVNIRVYVENQNDFPFRDETMLDHTFHGVSANSGQHRYRSGDASKWAEIELSYLNTAVTPEADGYQDRLETAYLAGVDLYSHSGLHLRSVALSYATLGADAMAKRVLKTIQAKNGAGAALDPGHHFTYYGEDTADQVSMGVADASQRLHAETGALYGALRSYTVPEGATYAYEYDRATLDGPGRDLVIRRPQNDSADWTDPRTYFGPDHAVITWAGTGANQGQLYITAYRWVGQWVGADLGSIPVSAEQPATVEVRAEYFAVITPGQPVPARLYSKQPAKRATWQTYELPVSATRFQVAAGDRFFALVDHSTGQLYRYRRERSTWSSTDVALRKGTRTVFGMGASGDTLVTVTAVPDNEFNPEVRVHRLDLHGDWQMSTQLLDTPYCRAEERSGSISISAYTGIEEITVRVGDSLAAVQVRHTHTAASNVVAVIQDLYPHYAHRWDENGTLVETRALGSELALAQNAHYRPRLTVLGSMVSIDHVPPRVLGVGAGNPRKYVYRYLGSGWYDADFAHDSLDNNYLGIDCFTVTVDGHAQYHEWNPTLLQWDAKMPDYTDGNPTLWEKLWSYLSLGETFVSMAVEWEFIFFVDLAFLASDQLVGQLAHPAATATRANRFFAVADKVYYRQPDATWNEVGALAEGYSSRPVGEWSESRSINSQSTQAAAEFVAFTVQVDRTKVIIAQDGSAATTVHHSGYPRESSWVRLLRNGQFRGAPQPLPDGESVKRHEDDRGELVGANAFVTYSGGGKLSEATALHLYRVGNAAFTGVMDCFVAAAESVDDGQGRVYTHYRYEDGAATPTGDGALFGKVEVLHSGGSAAATDDNGVSKFFFYNGTTTPRPLWPAGSNAGDYPVFAAGRLYCTEVFTKAPDGSALQVDQSLKLTWKVTEDDLGRGVTRYLARMTREESVTDGMHSTVDTDYEPSQLSLPSRVSRTHVSVEGIAETLTTSYRYAWQDHPELLAMNMLTATSDVRVTSSDAMSRSTLLEATGVSWAQAVPAPPHAIPSNTWPGLGYLPWDVGGTYRARTASEAPFTTRGDPVGWLRTAQVRVRSASGLPIEVVDVDAIETATVFDTAERFAVAVFRGASVARAEAGYLGFEAYEELAGWTISGAAQPQLQARGYTGPACLSGSSAAVHPNRFEPRHAVSYVVAAWIRPRQGGSGASLGFGGRSSTISASDGTWKYVEHVDDAPAAADRPFVQCDGEIDCIRFGPVDTLFSATVYDPDYHHVIATHGNNGEVIRRLYDDHQNLVAELQGVLSSHGMRETPSRFLARRYGTPNTRLVLTSQDRGLYMGAGPWNLQGAETLDLLPHLDKSPFETPSGYGVRFRLRRPDSVRIQIGPASSVDLGPTGVQVVDPAGNSDVSGDPGSDDFLLVLLLQPIRQLLLFAGGRPLINRAVQSGPEMVRLSLPPSTTAAAQVSDLLVFSSPMLTLSYADGLGREIQAQRWDPSGPGLVATQTLYDGWGHPAVQTRPIPVEGAVGYMPGLATGYDWETGALRGPTSIYYGDSQRFSRQPGDENYAAIRKVAEHGPLARLVELRAPGRQFASGGAPRVDRTRNSAVQALMTALGLTQTDAFRAVTTHLPRPSGTVVDIQLFDQAGNRVARRTGKEGRWATATYKRVHGGGVTLATVLPPNAHAETDAAAGHRYRTVVHTDLLGRVTEREDCDTGIQQFVHDRAGRLRFGLDGAGAALAPNRVLYRKYDRLGRPTEQGQLDHSWDRAWLQHHAETVPDWPAEADGAVWSTRWSYDSTSTPDTLRGKGRLRQIMTQGTDGQQVTEEFTYDELGNISGTSLRVAAYDNSVRSVHYTYDLLGRVRTVRYPGGNTVWYRYNAAGLLSRIGLDDAPARYASYRYNADGSLAAEYLNNDRYAGRYLYDFYGNLRSLDYSAEGSDWFYFRVGLEYADSNGSVGPEVTTATYRHAHATNQSYRYRYTYDELGRLTGAQTVTEGGVPRFTAHPAWDLTGVTYDANGNLQTRTESQQTYTLAYQTGSNRLSGMLVGSSSAQSITTDGNGRITSTGSLSDIRYTPFLSVPVSVGTGGGQVRFRYSGSGKRVLKTVAATSKLYVHGAGASPIAEESAGVWTDYIHGPRGIVAACKGGHTYTVMRDHLGSTRFVFNNDDNESDGVGHERHRFNYLPFGALMPDTSTAPADSPVPYLFTGQEYDAELGCYNYKARLYDPSMGRFHSPDPAGEWFSPYSYVGGNPISRIDPSGLLSRSGLRWALGGAYTAVYAAVGTAIGASVGAITGAALGIDAQETAGIGALSGAAAGASVGIARGGWEALVGSRRIRPASVAGERFPVVLYYEGQRTLGFESGRLGAELIAEQERIPHNLWKEHLIPYQIHLGQYPERFNGRVIAVAHGARSDGLVELGLTGQRGARDTAEEFARMFHARGQAPWPVNQIDMCICYAQSSGFASGVRGRLAARVLASPMTVTPVGPGRSMGVIRAVDAGADIRNFTIMRAAGAPMTDEPFRGIWEIEDQVS